MNPETTSLGYAVLALLDKVPSTGYDLCQIFQTTPMGHYSSSPGAIYPALERLERRGLITGRTDRARTLRPRQIYRPTKAGRAALVAWVSRPMTADDVDRRLDELLLRFAFMGELVSPAVSRTFLIDLTAHLEAHIADLERHLAMMPARPPNGRLALRSGIAQRRGLLDWARQAVQELGPQPRRKEKRA